MGPIEKKIEKYLSNDSLSEETILFLKSLKNELSPIEKQLVNDSYYHGFSDKEKGKSLRWDYYSSVYVCLLKKTKFGQLS